MKKFLMIIILSLLFMSDASALPNDTHVTWSQDSVFPNLQSYSILNGSPYWSGRHYLYASGQTAYCIQRGVDITTRFYSSSTDFSILGIGEETKKRLELISTFGYNYIDTNPLTYLATQQMLWAELGSYVTWHNGKNLGDIYNTQPIIDMINKNIDSYLTKPSFNGGTYEGNVGDTIIIDDTNGVISRYKLLIPFIPMTINKNNQVSIRITKPGIQEVSFRRGDNLLRPSKIYTAYNSQALLTAGLSFTNTANFFIRGRVDDVFIKINKKDIDTNDAIKESVAFKIKDLSTNLYLSFDGNEIITVDNGSYTHPYPIKAGKYELIEVSTTGNYTINKTPLYFEINDNTNISCNNEKCYTELDFYNKEILGQIKITKTGDHLTSINDAVNFSQIPLKDIEFEVYDKKDNYIETIKTNEEGIALSSILKLGKYKIKEITTKEEYELDDTIYNVVLSPNDQTNALVTEEVKLNNKLKKGRLSVLKVDIDSKKPLNNALFSIYDNNNDFLTNVETIDNGTNDLELPLGTYYIKEVRAPKGYLIDDEIKEINIETNTTAHFVSEDKKIVLPKTGLNDNDHPIRLAGIFILFITSIISIKHFRK